MKKLLAMAVLALLLGALLGSFMANHNIRQRSQQLAVMWLADYHLEALRRGVATADCANVERSRGRLHLLAEEIALAFPKTDAQEQSFHRHRQDLLLSTAAAPGAGKSCAVTAEQFKQVAAACDGCHRDYR